MGDSRDTRHHPSSVGREAPTPTWANNKVERRAAGALALDVDALEHTRDDRADSQSRALKRVSRSIVLIAHVAPPPSATRVRP